MNKNEKRVIDAAMRLWKSRDRVFGDGSEQWHGYRFSSPNERILFAACSAYSAAITRARARKGER